MADRDWDNQTIAYLNKVASRYAGSAMRAEWHRLEDIVEILNDLGAVPNMNHAHFPNGGGLDLCGAELSHERGCIELNMQGRFDIVRPHSLELERFDADRSGEWTYFRLNLAPLKPTGVSEAVTYAWERLTRIASGEYEDSTLLDSPDRPAGAEPAMRWLKGAIIVVAKGSAYNHDPSTYDGRHSLGNSSTEQKQDVGSAEFRRYIERCVQSNAS